MMRGSNGSNDCYDEENSSRNNKPHRFYKYLQIASLIFVSIIFTVLFLTVFITVFSFWAHHKRNGNYGFRMDNNFTFILVPLKLFNTWRNNNCSAKIRYWDEFNKDTEILA